MNIFIQKKEKEIVDHIKLHVDLVSETVESFIDALYLYLDGEKIKSQAHTKQTHKLESQADDYRRKVNREMFEGAFMPSIREALYVAVDAVDNVANEAETTGDILTLVEPKIPTEIKQDIRKIECQGENLTIGPRHFIKSVQFENDGVKEEFTIKDFDAKNLLLISRFWECGSCPHLFVKRKRTDEWEYIGEVFSDKPDLIQRFEMNFDIDLYKFFKVVELENEVTSIDSIYLDEKEVSSLRTLKKNDEFTFKVDSAKSLVIKGSYTLIDGEKYNRNDKMKSQKILYKLTDLNIKNETPTTNIRHLADSAKYEDISNK